MTGLDIERARAILIGRIKPALLETTLAELETAVTVTPFNLIQGQWFIGTEPLPNQVQLTHAEQKLARISALHVEEKVPENGFTQGWDWRWCAMDHEPWPCRTWQILTE